MRYVSTRGGGQPKPFLEILLEGLAPDGGLYVPEAYPLLNPEELERMRVMSYPELAFAVISRFADDIPAPELKKILDETYTKETFGSEDIVPLQKVTDGVYLLDLSEGPTLAFKDIALQFLGRLFEYVLKKRGESLNILGATSGDTGSAAEYAMRGRSGVNVFMLSPHQRMSEFQRKQMFTLHDMNIFNIAIRGPFDDCQDVVKAVNADAEFKRRYKLGAVNSINWARIVAQTVYYFWGYFRATAKNTEKVSFAVPSGNFGNILSGYVARQMGLPIHRLILATNENDVLSEFFNTGIYRPRGSSEVAVTSSPSMDISKASNFERYVYDLVGRNPARMKELWERLGKDGAFDISNAPEFMSIKDTGFVASSSSHADRLEMIRSLFQDHDILIDPHTADGVKVAFELREPGESIICLMTALPAKFADTIFEATGLAPEIPTRFKELSRSEERFEVMPPDVEMLKSYIAAHARSI